MKIKIVAEHPSAQLRMSILVPTFQRHGHTIVNNAKDADLYFLDCMRVCDIPDSIIDEVLEFHGKIILTSLGDWHTFNLTMNNYSLPSEIVDRASAFAKIQWSPNQSIYDKRIINKQIIIQPFLIGGLPKPSDNKKQRIVFYGLPTGEPETDQNLRIRACHILKNQPWFDGGIVGQEPGIARNISGIEIGHRPRNVYLNAINQSTTSLCMPGNSILTYRHFESLGMKCAVITCCLDKYVWLNRMVPGEHYFKVNDDLSNLLDMCEWIIGQPNIVNEVAQNGYSLYQQYYRLNPDNSMTDEMWQDIQYQFKQLGINL